MTIKLVNRFEDEVIELKGVTAAYVAPKFKEIRVTLNGGTQEIFSAITYELEEA